MEGRARKESQVYAGGILLRTICRRMGSEGFTRCSYRDARDFFFHLPWEYAKIAPKMGREIMVGVDPEKSGDCAKAGEQKKPQIRWDPLMITLFNCR